MHTINIKNNVNEKNHLNRAKPTLLSREKKLTHLAAFKQSGLTMTAYCKQQGLKISAFSNWNARYAKKKNTTFLPAQLKSQQSELKNSQPQMILKSLGRLEIHKGDLKIILPETNHFEAMLNLVKTVISCN